jgi:hypothetical protein
MHGGSCEGLCWPWLLALRFVLACRRANVQLSQVVISCTVAAITVAHGLLGCSARVQGPRVPLHSRILHAPWH